MDRRQFIKNTGICACALCAGCNVFAQSSKQQEDDFIYRHKSDLPKKISIDACTICQLKCPQCWRVTEPTLFDLGYLKFDDFKNFIDKYDIEKVELSNKGEIFLNPELSEIIKYAHEKDIAYSAANGVNGNYLTDDMAELLVKTQCRELTFSIDGATNDVYKIYRVGGNLDKVLENLKKVLFYKNKYSSQYPFVSYKFIVFGHNEHEIPLAKELAKKLGVPILFNTNYAPWYSPVKNKKFVEEQTGLHFDDMTDQYISDWVSGKSNWFPCKTLWDDPVINFDGKFLGCCLGTNRKNFGNLNIFKQGYLKVMNNKNIRYAKKMLKYDYPPKDEIPCTNCDMDIYNRLKKYNQEIFKG
ncbi:MAG: radical SAM protein [Candidatus Melainabacteria bacterium]|nr:MAG: radical SAM protein [Candidatus Melainabacteria bacterium]